MSTLTRSPSSSTLDSQFLNGVHLAFEGFGKGLAAKLAALFEEQLAGRKVSGNAAERTVADLVPSLVEQEFIARFLLDKESAKYQRAMLAHLLTAVEVQGFAGLGFRADLAPPPTAEAEGEEELTSEAAAKLLHVSRTHLNTLVDTGQLGEVRRTSGGHRRISKTAVLRYKARSKARQAKGLDAMMEASERLGLYDQELAGIPDRSKR